MLSGYFLLILFSGLWSENQTYLAGRLQVILPFLVLPFAFHTMSNWKEEWFNVVIIIFLLLNLGAILWSVNQYLRHKEMYDAGYGYSHSIPTLFQNDHIRFSMTVVMSLMFSIELLSRFRIYWIRFLLLLLVLVDILFLHLLAAKTGLLALYFTLFLLLIRMIFVHKKKILGVILLLCSLTLPCILFFVMPSFKNKLGYVRYSIEQILNSNKQANVSDEGRIISYQYALKSIRLSPWIGVGMGDVYDEMEVQYHQDFAKDVKVILPHNQFLMTGMAVGIGGIAYLICMLMVLFKAGRTKGFLYHWLMIILFFSMLVEPLFETQYGTCIFLFFSLLLLKRSNDSHEDFSPSSS